jgi:hypothetical protein
VVLLDADGSVASINREAAAWLDEISAGATFPGAEHPIPFEAFSFAARASGLRPTGPRHSAPGCARATACG